VDHVQVGAAARLNRRLRSERDPDNELSIGQLSVLGALFRNGPCSIGDLAAQERVQPPSMTRTVNCLEEAGYVERRAHETDRRQVVVALADKGAETLAADRKRRDAWLAQRMRDLTPEERSMLRHAAPIIERLAHA
jgi:DNA-binding MarR family transcriptional regulator